MTDEELLGHATEFKFEHEGVAYRLHLSTYYEKWMVHSGRRYVTLVGEWDDRATALAHVLEPPADEDAGE